MISHLRLVCPYCQESPDRLTNLTGHESPAEGDVTLCMKCGEFSVFQGDLSLGFPTPEFKAELDTNPMTKSAKRAWRVANSSGGEGQETRH